MMDQNWGGVSKSCQYYLHQILHHKIYWWLSAFSPLPPPLFIQMNQVPAAVKMTHFLSTEEYPLTCIVCYHRRYRQVKMIQCRHTDIHSNLIIALQLMSCCWFLMLLFSWDYDCFPLLLLDNNVCVLEAKPLHSSVYVSDNFFALIKTTGCETV